MTITKEEISTIVREELKYVITNVPEVQYELTGVMAQTFAMRTDLQVLLKHMDAQGERIEALREDFNRQFADHSQRMDEMREDFNRQFAEYSQRMDHFAALQEKHSQRIDEMHEDFNRQFADHSQRMDHFAVLQEKHSQRVDEMRGDFNRQFAEYSRRTDKLATTIEGLGARWGMMAESAFREGLRGVLREAGWQVENYRKVDTRGIVFTEPDQVEIDVVIHDGAHSLIEIKSSVSQGDVEHFQRKITFYEQEEGVQVERALVISPTFDRRARELARARGMETYTSAYNVPGP